MHRIERAFPRIAVTALTVTALAIGSPLVETASAAPATPTTMVVAQTPTAQPDPVALMSDYSNYWKPFTYDPANATTKADTAFRGTVLDQGVLNRNDQLTVAINNAGAADLDQSRRALVDADYSWQETYSDALGPTLSTYFTEGLASGELPGTTAAINKAYAMGTGEAKPVYNYPRPFLTDRAFTGQANPSNLNGLQSHLNIDEIPDWTDPNTGKTHSAQYEDIITGPSQAFPSGHTTMAYSTGIALAQLLPQLGPEIITRASEAGNNRIVLGVHYPLDIMGGRIIGQANNSYLWSDSNTFSTVLQPAETELQNYLTQRCVADGLGTTLEACISNTDANGTHGYNNYFTDAVSTAPVVDRTSALKAFQSRMTNGFTQVGAAGKAPVVPDGAESLLATTFPSLSSVQRRAVLAATEIDSGYPLDNGSDGWQRINLAAAMSSKVTLDDKGTVTNVEPGQSVASVVNETPSSSPSATETSPAPSATETSPAPSATETSSAPAANQTPATSPSVTQSPSDSQSQAPSSAAPSSAVPNVVVKPNGPSGKSGLPLTGASGVGTLVGLAAAVSLGGAGLVATRKHRRH
ncbi:phosphatase PAP2 family protein [Propionibacterium sp.]|uniref:phosphatase PAP2 family protein n=1 Tax=Propionibacterium sp. TaxID=1977903 RepID=UPI0039E99C6B